MRAVNEPSFDVMSLDLLQPEVPRTTPRFLGRGEGMELNLYVNTVLSMNFCL